MVIFMKLKNIQINSKTIFTRKCIGEAVIRLLKNKHFDNLKISEISRIAGVSRTTFYQHYASPYDVLKDYLNIIVSEYLIENKKLNMTGKYFHCEHIVFSFNFYVQYADYFLTITACKLHSILFEAINDFMLHHISKDNSDKLYMLYAYSGALLNTFLKWIENGQKENVEDIAVTLETLIAN